MQTKNQLYFKFRNLSKFYLRPELLEEEPLELLLFGAASRLLETELPLLTEGEDWREELTLDADFVLGADWRETEGVDLFDELEPDLTADLVSFLLVEILTDFCGVLDFAVFDTAERWELLVAELRTALLFSRTFELFKLRVLFTEDDLSTLPVPREGLTAELRVVPDFCLTSEFVRFWLLLTVADFLSALFRCVTVAFLCVAEDLTAERVPTLFWVLVRDLWTAVELFVLDLLVEELLTSAEFLSVFFLA